MAAQRMNRHLVWTLLGVALPLFAVAHAQQTAAPAPTTPAQTPLATTLTGCIGAKPDPSGQYAFAGADGRARQIEGKGIRRFAGRRVELVLGSPGKGLTVRPGLWPTPSGGKRGAALDPSQAAVLRQPGGGGAGAGSADGVLSVSRIRSVPGDCK